MIWTSRYRPVAVGGTTLPSVVERAARAHPGRTAFIAGEAPADRNSVTFAELQRRIECISGWLMQAGVRAEDTVALWTPNTPPWAAFALAAMRIGASVTALSPLSTDAEASHQLRDPAAVVVLTTAARAEAARDAGVRRVVVVDSPGDGRSDALTEVLTASAPAPRPVADPDRVALVPYSSGTTGLPKPVMLTHTNLVTVLRQLTVPLQLRHEDTTLALAPMCHVMGSIVTTFLPLAVGATVVTVPRFDPDLVLQLIERHQVRFCVAPPQVADFLAHHPLAAERDLSSLQLLAVGGAPLPRPVEDDLVARLPDCVIGQGWGMTETAASICVPDRHDPAPRGTVGFPLPNTEIAVSDPGTGRSCGADELGELLVRGPQVMAGYRDRQVETAAIIDSEGWLRTGDLGTVDCRGAVTVHDRIKDLIKVDAYQVAPAELEALLRAHPGVRDAAVVGRADPRRGQVPVAVVVAAPDVDCDDLRVRVNQQVASYKQIADVRTANELPRSASGKLLRRLIEC